MEYKKEFDREEHLFIDNVIDFFLRLEIKDNLEAEKYEDRNTYEQAHAYTDAVLEQDIFESHHFSKRELKEVLFFSEEDANYHLAHNLIKLTDHQKDVLLKYKRKTIIEGYVEKNNYYRCRMGFPDYGEEPLKIKDKKVTDLSLNEINFTYHNELNELKKKHPDKKYLNYLGDKSIDLTSMRIKPDLSIIYYDKSIFNDTLNKELISIYYSNVGYVKAVLYTDAFADQEYYHKFMILFTCFMTIQKFINSRIEFAINRDFFDEESMKNMFRSYNLPYWKNLPFKYKKRIIKNINSLIMNKGTDKVILDIVNLFGFENVEIFRHYIVKNRIEDPITNKPTDDYELNFVGIPMDSNNVVKDIVNSTFIETYEDVVRNDPYWDGNQGDTIKQVLLQKEFNSINTKYLSINTMYNVCQLTNEVTYFFNMLDKMESEHLLDNFTFINTKIKPSGSPIRFYDAIVAIYSLICSRLDVEDNIIYSPTGVASIFGFNFEGDIDYIKNNLNGVILSDDYARTVKKLPIGLMQKRDLIDIFFNNSTYRSTLQEAMRNTDDYKTYKTLRNIYHYNMITQEVRNRFIKEDGTQFNTYTEYLYHRDGDLAEYVVENSMDRDLVLLALNEILFSLEVFIDSDKFRYVFLGLSTLVSDLIKDYMKTLINFFKAYTVDLRDMNIYYIFDDRFNNTIKLLNEVKVETFRTLNGEHLWMEDIETFTKLLNGLKDDMTFEEMYKFISTLSLEDIYKMSDEISEMIKNITSSSAIYFMDIESFTKEEYYKDTLEYMEFFSYTQNITEEERIKLLHLLTIKTNMDLLDSFSLNLEDIEYIMKTKDIDMDLNVRDKEYITSVLNEVSSIKLKDSTVNLNDIFKTNLMDILDIMVLQQDILKDENLSLEEKVDNQIHILNNYKLIFRHLIESVNTVRIESDMSVDLIESLFNSDSIIEHNNKINMKETFKIERNEENNGN